MLGRSYGKFYGGRYAALVLLREEFRTHLGDEDVQHHAEYHQRRHHNEFLVVHAPAYEAGITAGDCVQDLVHRAEHNPVRLVGHRLVVHQEGAQGGHQGKCRRWGHYHNDGNNPAQLLEHNAGHSGNHSEGQEHAQHGERGCDYGYTNLRGTVNGRLLGLFSPFKVRGHVLKHHYSIVHHHTYGYGKGAHGDDIEGASRCKQIEE